MQGCKDNEFDLAICDPPYGIGMSGGNVGYKGFNDLERKEWDKSAPCSNYFQELKRASKNQIIWGGNYFDLPPTRCFLIWDKGAGFKGRTYAECEQAWTSFDASAITAHYGGFEFVGMELDAGYYKVACERFKRETAQIDMFNEGDT